MAPARGGCGKGEGKRPKTPSMWRARAARMLILADTISVCSAVVVSASLQVHGPGPRQAGAAQKHTQKGGAVTRAGISAAAECSVSLQRSGAVVWCVVCVRASNAGTSSGHVVQKHEMCSVIMPGHPIRRVNAS
jgi:hypothetical protein